MTVDSPIRVFAVRRGPWIALAILALLVLLGVARSLAAGAEQRLVLLPGWISSPLLIFASLNTLYLAYGFLDADYALRVGPDVVSGWVQSPSWWNVKVEQFTYATAEIESVTVVKRSFRSLIQISTRTGESCLINPKHVEGLLLADAEMLAKLIVDLQR